MSRPPLILAIFGVAAVYGALRATLVRRTHDKAHKKSTSVPYVENGWLSTLGDRRSSADSRTFHSAINGRGKKVDGINAHNVNHNHEPARGEVLRTAWTLPVWMYPVQGNVIPRPDAPQWLGSTSMTTSNSTSHPKNIFQAGRMIGSTSTSTSSSSAHPKHMWNI